MGRGVRFAPSPTGAFHVGNFRTAWISHWWARSLGLPWVVRYEDIDRPRVVEGAMERQAREMASLGLNADVTIVQSARAPRHWDAFRRAIAERRVYPCYCSRKQVREAVEGAASAPHAPPALYNGHCRRSASPPRTMDLPPTIGWRFRSSDDESGAADFIVARTPGPDPRSLEEFVPSYNWACAIDDFDGRYDLLVRAIDLSGVARQQGNVQAMLGEWEGLDFAPAIFHCALVVGANGERLEKRTHGITLPELLAAGCSHADLVRKIEKSFSADVRSFVPGAVFGESRGVITLSELGLS